MDVMPMEIPDFEALLDELCRLLTTEARQSSFQTSAQFEGRVRAVLAPLVESVGLTIEMNPRAQDFPDIVLGEFGIEVKFTVNDTWRSIANSVFEGSRVDSVRHIYLLFGKMGGIPEVKWGPYGESIVHVRTSHVPRFEVEIGPAQPLLHALGVSYGEFAAYDDGKKMALIRDYARSRLKSGERLWWLEPESDTKHSLPIQARLYMTLDQAEKRRLRAEAALLCPEVVKPARAKHKYDNVALYLLTMHGVLCSQTRDLFSAGSVALRADDERGGNYVRRSLQDIEVEMRDAAIHLDDALFIEYWGESCAPERRIQNWLARADALADDWKPSEELFLTPR